jgi:hypothetical protein
MPQICNMRLMALLPFQGKACWGFFRLKNPTDSAGSEPAILGTRGQHANHQTTEAAVLYRVIHKSLRDFQPLRYSSRDGHAKREHVNRGRDTASLCPTSQVLDMSTLGDIIDVIIDSVFGKFQDTERFLIPSPCHVSPWLPPSGETCKYAMAPSTQTNLEKISTYWYAPLCCVYLGCSTAEFGSSGGTYELPCISNLTPIS